jgi:hypothetical protein
MGCGASLRTPWHHQRAIPGVTTVTDIRPLIVRHRQRIAHHRSIERPVPEDAMNILLWYLPFAMFSETCDLVIAECKAPAQGEPNAVRTRRPGAQHGAAAALKTALWHNWRR